MRVTVFLDERTVAVDDESEVDVGSVLCLYGRPVAHVRGLRGHKQRPLWTVLTLDRPFREPVYRGDTLTVLQ